MQQPTAESRARELFDEFKRHHPNSADVFSLNADDLIRWHWHVIQARQRQGYSTIQVVDRGALQQLSEGRGVDSFEQMPTHVQKKYLQLAALFPGRQIWAVGSRVDGTFVEADSPAQVRELRGKAGKAVKPTSDFDFMIEPLPGETIEDIKSKLPAWADLLIRGAEKKVAVPNWDFSRLPESEHSNVIALVEARKWGELMAIHNKYALSPYRYCCDETPIRRWFEWGIEQGLIKQQAQQ